METLDQGEELIWKPLRNLPTQGRYEGEGRYYLLRQSPWLEKYLPMNGKNLDEQKQLLLLLLRGQCNP